jgi:antitoxin VapB
MALSIRNRETERLAREVAVLTGESLTAAVHKALEERLQRLQARCERAEARRRAEILAIIEEAAALPLLDDRSEDEILGYDEHGLPA